LLFVDTDDGETIAPKQATASYVMLEKPDFLRSDPDKIKESVIDAYEGRRQKLVSGEIDENMYTRTSWLAHAGMVYDFFVRLGMNADLDYKEEYTKLEQSQSNLQPLPFELIKRVKPTLLNTTTIGLLTYGGRPAVQKIRDGEKYYAEEYYLKERLGLFKRVRPIDGVPDLAIHGVEKGVSMGFRNGQGDGGFEFGAHDFAKMIRKLKILDSDGVPRETGIRLFSCLTGDSKTNNNLAQSLANELGVKVLAPQDTVEANRFGATSVKGYGSDDGWVSCEPDASFVCPECTTVQEMKNRLTLMTKETISGKQESTLAQEQQDRVIQIKEDLVELKRRIKGAKNTINTYYDRNHPSLGVEKQLIKQSEGEIATLYYELSSIVGKESASKFFKTRELAELTSTTVAERIR